MMPEDDEDDAAEVEAQMMFFFALSRLSFQNQPVGRLGVNLLYNRLK